MADIGNRILFPVAAGYCIGKVVGISTTGGKRVLRVEIQDSFGAKFSVATGMSFPIFDNSAIEILSENPTEEK